MEAVTGLREIPTSPEPATFTAAEPVTEPSVAVTVVVPCATVDSNPPLLMLPILPVETDHITELLMSC